MSLQEGVIGVAQMMEDTAAEWEKSGYKEYVLYMRMYASHLRILVKTCPEQPVVPLTPPVMPAELQHAVMIEKARAEFRKDKQQENDPTIASLVGGNSNGDCIPIDPAMPVGAKTLVNGEVYQLRDDHKLHFVESAMPTQIGSS